MKGKQKKTVRAATYLFTNQMVHEYLNTKDRSQPGLSDALLEGAS